MVVPSLIVSAELRRLGESPRRLERAAAAGRLVRVRPGVFVEPDEWSSATAAERHMARVRAVASTSKRPLVFSHVSAAVVLGIPVVDADLSRPHVSQPAGMDPHLVGVVAHGAALSPDEVVECQALTVTNTLRTVVDLAATESFAAGVVAIDAAFADGLSGEHLAAWVEGRRPFRGAQRVEAAARTATGLAESPLESLSLARIVEFGFPPPRQQLVFGRYRGDFVWPDCGVWGEADGQSKYLEGTALWAEKRREDDIRTAYPHFVRWDWEDAWRGTPLAAKLERAGVPRDRRIASRRPA